MSPKFVICDEVVPMIKPRKVSLSTGKKRHLVGRILVLHDMSDSIFPSTSITYPKLPSNQHKILSYSKNPRIRTYNFASQPA